MLTELEKLERAKMYMDKLANGIDPISDTELPSDGALNNVRLSRCFFYVSDILRQVIERGGLNKPIKGGAKADFSLSPEQLKDFELSTAPLRISAFVESLNGLIDLNVMKKLTATTVTNWLADKSFLYDETVGGKKRRLPTKEGADIGLITDIYHGEYGEYKSVLYTASAQRFIIDNLGSILQSQGSQNV